MLVTMMVMLIMVLAMSQMIFLVGRHVNDGRALIELQGQLRNAAYRVQQDLDGVTARARFTSEVDAVGVLEYIEGADWDLSDTDQTIGGDNNPWWLNDSVLPPVEARPFFNASNPAEPLNAIRTAFGDIDDILVFTTRTAGKPFVGRLQEGILNPLSATPTNSVPFESNDAEVIYWTEWTDNDGDGTVGLDEVSLHRRVLLIRPDLAQFHNPANANSSFPNNMPYYNAGITPSDLKSFYANNDLSVRLEVGSVAGNPVIRLVPNSLADLGKRENRVAHLPATNNLTTAMVLAIRTSSAGYPHLLNRRWLPPSDDVVLSDVLAFDVRAYDPTAQLFQGSVAGTIQGDVLRPGDVGWNQSPAANVIGQGAYVDLAYFGNYNPTPAAARSSVFSGAPTLRSGMTAVGGSPLAPTYDSWTLAYEHDGINQDNDTDTNGNLLIDEGANGVDDDGANGVDDAFEMETLPPYLSPLRGVQITLRMIEPDSRQVRQVSLTGDFVPQ